MQTFRLVADQADAGEGVQPDLKEEASYNDHASQQKCKIMYALPRPKPLPTRVDAHPCVEQVDQVYAAESFLVLLLLRLSLYLFIMIVQLIDAVGDASIRPLQAKCGAVAIPPFAFEVHIGSSRANSHDGPDQSDLVVRQGIEPARYALVCDQPLADGIQATRVTSHATCLDDPVIGAVEERESFGADAMAGRQKSRLNV